MVPHKNQPTPPSSPANFSATKTPTNMPIKKTEFEIFAAINPHEAHQLNKTEFCNYVRKRICSTLTDEEVETLLNVDALKETKVLN